MLDDRAQAGPATRFGAHVVAALVAVVLGGVVFGVLLSLVLATWEPLRDLDREVSLWLNELVAASDPAAGALRVITTFGDAATTVVLLTLLTVVLLVRRLSRLALWVGLTGLGLAVLDPVVKELVARPRPVLPVEIATAPGQSFPSGHALASFTTFTVLLLVALPSIPRQHRRWAVTGTVAIVFLVGFSRVALGVHYVSDVVAGWALAAVWVSLTALAFRAWREDRGGVAPPLSEGLEPEAGDALRPAPAEEHPMGRRPGRTAALLAAGLAGVVALVAALGLLVTGPLQDTVVGRFDRAVVQALTGRSDPAVEAVLDRVGALGGTRVVIIGTLAACVLAVAVLRRWRPALFVVVSMLGEAAVYLLVSRVLVPRDRPEAGVEAGMIPATASFPSGHAAAAMTLYGAVALVVIAHRRGRWRWAILLVPIGVGLLVAASRLNQGVHYPTDVLGSALLAVTWLTVTYRLLLHEPAPQSPEPRPAVLTGSTTARSSPAVVSSRGLQRD